MLIIGFSALAFPSGCRLAYISRIANVNWGFTIINLYLIHEFQPILADLLGIAQPFLLRLRQMKLIGS